MSSLHGDAAVARLDAAVDAFLDIMTAPENTLVPVPERSPQPSLAERARVNLKPSTDLAKGYADAARCSAQEAAQITGLETVADAIGLAALPLPDVWAPLSDNLRLITGYGREVLVGSDVVARMVNFSRSTTATYIGKDGLLKTAAANEPRFEKEGLLIEGQSTNIWPAQIPPGMSVSGTTVVNTKLPDGTLGDVQKLTPNPTSFSHARISIYPPAGIYTASCYAKRDDGSDAMPTIYAGHTGAFNFKAAGVYVSNGWWRMTVTLTNPSGNTGWGFAPTSADSIPVLVCHFQLEALPFASSYIPTNGAAVTRTKDILYLSSYGNVPRGLDMAFSAQVRVMGKGLPSWPRIIEIADTANKGPYVDLPTGKWGTSAGVDIVGRQCSVAARFSDSSYWLDGAKLTKQWSRYTAEYYGEPVYIAGSSAAGSRDFYGHVRNVRMWFLSLSDAQMKAAK